MHDDVPSPIDLQRMPDALAWEASALEKRPCRPQFFAAFSRRIADLCSRTSVPRVLELGSGPGFLAQCLLRDHASITYVALDFSAAMHRLAAARLAAFDGRITFVERSFRAVSWEADLGTFDGVVTNQAVHELRHKRHHHALHAAVRRILRAGGIYLVCDHFHGAGGQANDQLYMTVAEQHASLRQAGFAQVENILETGGLVLHAASDPTFSPEAT